MPTNKYQFKPACVCVVDACVCELFILHSVYRQPYTLVHSEWKQQTIISFNVISFSFHQIDFNRFVRFYTFVLLRCKVRLCYLACIYIYVYVYAIPVVRTYWCVALIDVFLRLLSKNLNKYIENNSPSSAVFFFQ